MRAKLPPAALRIRTEAFEKAKRFLENAGKVGGVRAPVSESYQNEEARKRDGTERVDIEVRKGKAFV